MISAIVVTNVMNALHNAQIVVDIATLVVSALTLVQIAEQLVIFVTYATMDYVQLVAVVIHIAKIVVQ